MSNTNISPFSYSNYINPDFGVNKKNSTSVPRNSEKVDSFENTSTPKKQKNIKAAVGAVVVFGSAILGFAVLKKNNKNLKKSFELLFKDDDMKGVSFIKKLKTLFAGDEAIDKLSKKRKPSPSNLDELFEEGINSHRKTEIPDTQVEDILEPQEKFVDLKQPKTVEVESESGQKPLNMPQTDKTKEHIKGDSLTDEQDCNKTFMGTEQTISSNITGEVSDISQNISSKINADGYKTFLSKLVDEKYSSNPTVVKMSNVDIRDFDKAIKSQDVSDMLTYYEKLSSRYERFVVNPDKKEVVLFMDETMPKFERYLLDEYGITVKKVPKGTVFDQTSMKKIDTVRTTKQALDGTVESIYHPGFVDSNGTEIRPLRVNVYQFSQE